RSHRRLRLRDRLSGLHRATARSGRRRQEARASPPGCPRSGGLRRARGSDGHPRMTAASLERRFANFRIGLARESPAAYPADIPRAPRVSRIGAEGLAASLDGELIQTDRGAFVRLEAPSTILPLDRERLARVPG